MPKRAPGRPSKLTPEIQDRICASLRAGNYACSAARMAGIAESTFYDWLEQGKRAKIGRFSEFSEAVSRAEVEGESMAITAWRGTLHPGLEVG